MVTLAPLVGIQETLAPLVGAQEMLAPLLGAQETLAPLVGSSTDEYDTGTGAGAAGGCIEYDGKGEKGETAEPRGA
jgi:hypothetical protein